MLIQHKPDAILLIVALILLLGLPSRCPAAEPAPSSRSLSLADAIALAAQTNLTVTQAREDAAVAEAGARSAAATTKPSLSSTTYATIGDSGNILASSPGVMPQNLLAVPSQGFADQNIIFMAPLYNGGKLTGEIESARLQSIAAKFGIAAAQLTAQSDATQAYARALLTQELSIVARARVLAEEEQVRVTQDRVNAGHVAPVDLLREQAELADANQAQLTADNNDAIALIDLKTVLGFDLDTELTLTDTLDSAAAQSRAIPATLDEALNLAMRMRPELQAASAQVDAAGANVHAAQGAYAPQIYGVGMADASLSDGDQSAGFTVGITASLPLYDSGERRADVDAAQARSDRSRTDALKERQLIAQQVSTAWLNLQTALAQVDAASSGVAAASEGYRLADLRYNAGKSITAERLDALAASTRAQGALAQAKADVISARGTFLATIAQDAAAKRATK